MLDAAVSDEDRVGLAGVLTVVVAAELLEVGNVDIVAIVVDVVGVAASELELELELKDGL